jgi:4-hydroxybenzoyl-CoA thioesterase
MFATQRPLRFGDCDPSGIAYFPSYLDLMVGVVEEFFDTAGIPWSVLVGERRIGTPTLKLDLMFLKPGFHGDTLDFEVRLIRLGKSSMDLEHTISAAGEKLWTASQRLVATSLETHQSCAWPDDVRAAFMPFLETPDE